MARSTVLSTSAAVGRARSRLPAPRVYSYLVLALVTLITVFPLLWAFLSSLKPSNEVFTVPFELWPRSIHLENYALPFERRPLGRYLLNSLGVALVVTATTVFFSSLAGYGLAKFRFPGRDLIFVFFLCTLMLPLQVIVVPLFVTVKQLGLINTYAGLIAPSLMSAFGIFLMRQFIGTIPDDFVDAARVDGASEVGIFARIILPMSSAPASALAILTFIGNWNDFFWPLIVISRDPLRTIPLGLVSFLGEYQSEYNQMLAVAMMAIAPLLVLFVVMQRRFIEGIALSGLKG
jgi:ABC-type glycerol-3-phosphate transport system permease component